MSDRVLVTGATGFVGSHLVEALLEKGDHVACLVRPTSETADLPVDQLELRTGDVTDPAALAAAVKGVDVVYHLAGAIAGPSLERLDAVNKEGALNLALACRDRENPPVVVLLSSLEAAGPDPDGRRQTEELEPSPVSNYGRSKLASEAAVRPYADLIPLTIVRASAVFGERDRETLAVAKAMQLDGLALFTVPRARAARLSLIHARDLAELMILASGKAERITQDPGDHGQGLYYAADEERLLLGQIVEKIAGAFSRGQPRIIDVPIAFAWVIAGLYESWARVRGRSPGVLSIDKIRSFSSGSFTCSSEKAQEQLGFSPARSLENRIDQTIEWYRTAGWL